MKTKFLLLLGPSGAGKTTIIKELRLLDERYTYISPFVTRELRPGETDKFHVSTEELAALEVSGELIAVNEMYGARYGTPRRPIVEALTEGRFPVLDWPVARMRVMQAAFRRSLLHCVYIRPPSLKTLADRIRDGRDTGNRRLREAAAELRNLGSGKYGAYIDYQTVSNVGGIQFAAFEVHNSYLRSMGGKR